MVNNILNILWEFGYRMTDTVGEILNGIRCYFDKALPVLLLYKKERQQYHEAVSDNVSPSSVYGAEHLLRLFGMHSLLISCFVGFLWFACLMLWIFLFFQSWDAECRVFLIIIYLENFVVCSLRISRNSSITIIFCSKQ